MAGFPFPDGEASNREQSWDSGTPFSSGGDILIDPALSEVPLDPALMAEEGVPGSSELSQPPPLYPHNYLSRVQEYLQGPRGDPFAQPPPLYFPNEEPLPLPPKPLKKKKRPPARRERCDVCKGNEMRNQYGKSEQMVSCMDCGASVHPSCIRFYNRGELLRSLGWQCFTCKSCSVCKRKGNEASMLMCDFCDRGWHMSCFDPPFQEPPEGRWHCPTCPSVEDSQPWLEDAPPEQPPHLQEISSSSLPIRESSVASSSHHIPPSSDAPAFFDDVLTTDASELEVEHIDPTDPTPRRSSRKRKSRKGKEVAWEDDMGQHISPVTPVPTIRRLRIHVNSPPPHPADNETPTIRLRVPARGKGKAREDPPSEESERGLFDDILSVEDRDVRDTSMGVHDHERFERSRSNAEQRIAPRPPPDPPETPIAGPSHRPSLRSHAPITPRFPSASMSPAPTATPGPQAMYLPNGLRIRKIRFGEYDIDTWYDAPFPEEYAAIPDGRLWMCEFCLKYMKSRFSATRHQLKCKVRHPPGDEIYRDGKISIFEVDGRKNKIYCQNLCLLSKMFLDHKSLFYDVEPFLFYVMTETDDAGAHFVGYFSKEKLSPKDYNVSCIMTLPVRQRQGWGNLLIDFSYLLSKKEQRAGSPEKPLSALGALGYRNYWTLSLMRYLQTAPPNPTLEDISAVTSMTLEDIHTTLVNLNMISVLDSVQPPKPLPGQAIKFPKGRKNGIARKHLQRTHTHDDERAKGPFVPPTRYKVRWDAEQVDDYLARWEAKGYLRLTPEKLKWSPFILSRAKKTQSSEGEASFGSGTGDVTRGVSTDAQLSEMNGTAREGARSSAEARRLVEQTRSPAFSLFDDDNVEMIRPSAPSETTEADGSLGRSSVDPADTFRGKRNLLRDVSPSIRRLRSRDPVNESTPLRRLPHTPRADNSSQSDGRRHPLRSRPADISATIPLPDDVNGHAPSLDDDAALAARLAMELDNPRRQLRSRRPSTDQMQVQKRQVPISRSVSPRKRRRVDSSPEVELTPSPRSPVTRRSGRNGETAFASPKAIPATPSRKSSRRTNGRSPSKYALRQEEEEEEEDLPQAPVGGGMVDGGAATDGEEPEDANYEEGADTPATGAASSHSVPSDDTMIGAELARSKVSPISRMLAADMDPLSVLAQVAGQVANGDVVLDDGGEEDAEGEEDVDAEGEPDRDVDP